MEAFEKVYELYFKDVYRYMLSLCRDAGEAEEITQETFFRAMKNMSSFRGDCKMTVWLCQIAKNIYFKSKKEQKKRQERVGKPADDVVPPSLEHLICEEAYAMRIHELLHRMEEPYKEVFMLRVFGELSFRKIACLFEKTESWARVTYHRARLKLMSEMEESNERGHGQNQNHM